MQHFYFFISFFYSAELHHRPWERANFFYFCILLPHNWTCVCVCLFFCRPQTSRLHNIKRYWKREEKHFEESLRDVSLPRNISQFFLSLALFLTNSLIRFNTADCFFSFWFKHGEQPRCSLSISDLCSVSACITHTRTHSHSHTPVLFRISFRGVFFLFLP